MSILGKLVNAAGQATIYAAGATIKASGAIVSGVGKAITNNDYFGEGLKEVTCNAGNSVYGVAKSVGKGCEKVVDTTFQAASGVGGGVAKGTAVVLGASDEGVRKAEMVGRIAGGVGVGLLAGDVISGGIIGVAGMGTASTGTFIGSLHGVAASNATWAAIGGGALSAGGGGMAAGHAVLAAVDAGTALDGAVAGARTADNDFTNKEKRVE